MSVLSRLLGPSKTKLEKALEEAYAQQLASATGQPLACTRLEVGNAMAVCKEQAKVEGTDRLPANFGDALLRAAAAGEVSAAGIVRKARNEGARDEDILEWWNLHNLQRRMVLWSESTFRYANFLAFREQGLSPDDAMHRVRSMFPMYGDPDDQSHWTGEDRPLPHELRGRVDVYREKHGAAGIAERCEGYPSYNAFVRDELRRCRL